MFRIFMRLVKIISTAAMASYLAMTSTAYAQEASKGPVSLDKCTPVTVCVTDLEQFISANDGMIMIPQEGYPEYTFSRGKKDGSISEQEYIAGSLQYLIKYNNLDSLSNDPKNGVQARAALMALLKNGYSSDFERMDVTKDKIINLIDDQNRDNKVTLEDKTAYRVLQKNK